MNVLSIDPGTTTGWAIRGGGEGERGCGQETKWDFVGWLDQRLMLGGALRLHGVVCERMEITARTLKVDQAGVHDGFDVIGACRWLCQKYDVHWAWQTPAQKNRVSDDKLKQLGLWEPGMPHANDAQRHLLLFELRTGLR